MKTAAKPHRWTSKALKAEVAKLDNEVEIFWDCRDELSNEDIQTIISEGREGVDEVEMETVYRNDEYLWEQKQQMIDERLTCMRSQHPVSDSAEKRFRVLVEDSDKLLYSANLKQLGRNTDVDLVFVVTEPELSYQAYRGVESKGQVDELCEILALLNVNPAHLQTWVTVDNAHRPSYAPEPVVFPSHPERDGHEYVTLESVRDIMNETMYGGQLLFMVRMKGDQLLDDIEDLKSGPVVISKGTYCFPYCFMNGAGPCAEMILQKDLVLAAGRYAMEQDSAYRYGVQSCYGFTAKPWKAGSATPLQTEASHGKETKESPAAA